MDITKSSLFLATGLLGCATTSVTQDLDRIEELSRITLARPLIEASVQEELAAEAVEILAAPLTADSAVRLALLNNRDLRATLRSVGIARGELVQAGLLPNPTFEVDLRRPIEGNEPLQKEFFVEFDLTHALLAGARSDAAAADLEAKRYEVAGEVIVLGYRARTMFYAFQAAQQRYLVAQRMLDALAAGREAAQALFEAGNTTELDLASQEVAYEDARATAAEIELEMLERREELHDLLGLHGEATAWTTTDSLPAIPETFAAPDDVERRAIDASLTLQETKQRLEAIAHRTGLARAQGWAPDVAIDVHAEQDEEIWEVGGGFSFTLPVFDRQQGRLAAYEAEFDALSERYVGEAISLRSAARRARNLALSAYARAKQYQHVIVPARARVMQHTLLQYNAMQVGVFQLLTARRAQLEAELAYISTLREFWTAQAALEALLNGRAVTVARASSTTISAGGSTEGGH